MSDPVEEEQAYRRKQQQARLQRRMAELAASVADTEEEVAGTFEAMSERRPGPDAERLRAKARHADLFLAPSRITSASTARAGS